MSRIGRNDPNLIIIPPRKTSCEAETISSGRDPNRHNRPRLDVVSKDGRSFAFYLDAVSIPDLIQSLTSLQ